MSAMGMALGFGVAPAAREAEREANQRRAWASADAAVQEGAMGKAKLDMLTINELLFQALFGDLSQFC